MYNGLTWWVLCMNRPAVCVIQYTPWTGISSYKRGTYFNVFVLHRIQYMWNFIMYITTVHIITITHYNIAQRVVCTISQPSKVSAHLIIGDFALLFKSVSLTISGCISLTHTMDQLFLFTSVSVSLTVFFLSLFQLYYRAADSNFISQQGVTGCEHSGCWEGMIDPHFQVLPCCHLCYIALPVAQLYLLLVVCPIAICPSYITWLVFVNDWSSLPCVMCIPIAICHHFCSGHSSLLVRNAPTQITPFTIIYIITLFAGLV